MPRLSDLSYRYKKLRAHLGYDYPALFIAAGAAKTIAQVGLVAGIAWYGVSVATKPPETLVADNQAVQTTLTSPAAIVSKTTDSTVQVEIPAVSAPVQQVHLSKTSGQSITHKIERPENKLLTSEWLLRQDPTAFTIQFGTSPDKDLLYRSAKTFDSEFPVVVFPFKRTPTNRPVYGFASGTYASLEEAKQGILELPESAFTYGPWVRPIGKLQKQIRKMSL